jgi:hypothetical protein
MGLIENNHLKARYDLPKPAFLYQKICEKEVVIDDDYSGLGGTSAESIQITVLCMNAL